MQRAQPADGVVDVGKRLENREEDGSKRDFARLPLAEDHHRQGQEAFENQIGSREQFRKIFGRNWL